MLYMLSYNSYLNKKTYTILYKIHYDDSDDLAFRQQTSKIDKPHEKELKS